MSCYEWEKGTILLPKSEFIRVRVAMRLFLQPHLDTAFHLSQEFWKALPTSVKKDYTRLGQWKHVYMHGVNGFSTDPTVPAAWLTGRTRVNDDWVDWYGDHLVQWDFPAKTYRRTLLRDMPKLTGPDIQIQIEDAEIQFYSKDNSVLWDVEENNRSRERANAHPIARRFWSEINKVRWTPTTGGFIIGNDEYNRDSESVGGGGNYITQAYGPLGKRQLERTDAA